MLYIDVMKHLLFSKLIESGMLYICRRNKKTVDENNIQEAISSHTRIYLV